MAESKKAPEQCHKISIWFRPETVKFLQRIQRDNDLGVLEDSIDWLIQGWQINQHQQFSWSFNQCRRPKLWFGQVVRHNPTGITGRISGIEWRRERKDKTRILVRRRKVFKFGSMDE